MSLRSVLLFEPVLLLCSSSDVDSSMILSSSCRLAQIDNLPPLPTSSQDTSQTECKPPLEEKLDAQNSNIMYHTFPPGVMIAFSLKFHNNLTLGRWIGERGEIVTEQIWAVVSRQSGRVPCLTLEKAGGIWWQTVCSSSMLTHHITWLAGKSKVGWQSHFWMWEGLYPIYVDPADLKNTSRLGQGAPTWEGKTGCLPSRWTPNTPRGPSSDIRGKCQHWWETQEMLATVGNTQVIAILFLNIQSYIHHPCVSFLAPEYPSMHTS